MSKVFKAFGEALVEKGWYKKLFDSQTPGNRIAPPKAGNNDAKHQVRFDAGEVIDGKKNIYLQVNSQAKNEALKKYKGKEGTHANLATATIDLSTPPEKQEEVVKAMIEEMEEQVRENLN